MARQENLLGPLGAGIDDVAAVFGQRRLAVLAWLLQALELRDRPGRVQIRKQPGVEQVAGQEERFERLAAVAAGLGVIQAGIEIAGNARQQLLPLRLVHLFEDRQFQLAFRARERGAKAEAVVDQRRVGHGCHAACHGLRQYRHDLVAQLRRAQEGRLLRRRGVAEAQVHVDRGAARLVVEQQLIEDAGLQRGAAHCVFLPAARGLLVEPGGDGRQHFLYCLLLPGSDSLRHPCLSVYCRNSHDARNPFHGRIRLDAMPPWRFAYSSSSKCRYGWTDMARPGILPI